MKSLNWGAPTEYRKSVVYIAHHPQLDLDHEDKGFAIVSHRLRAEYPELRIARDPAPLVVNHLGSGYDSPGENWWALNPTIGYALGWILHEEGLFRWCDQHGTVMVESIWWVDGLLDQAPPHPQDEVAEGWLVVAKRAALEEIRKRYPRLQRNLEVHRYFTDEEGRDHDKGFSEREESV